MPTTPEMSMDMTTVGDTGLLDTPAARGRGLRPPCRTDPARRSGAGAQLHGPRRVPAAQPPRQGRPDGRQGARREHGDRLLDGHPAGRPARRHRARQAHLAPRGRTGRGAPAVAARSGPARRSTHVTPPADGRADDGWEPEEREAFCSLLTRFNTALSARQASHGVPAADPDRPLLSHPDAGPVPGWRGSAAGRPDGLRARAPCARRTACAARGRVGRARRGS